MAAVEGRDRGEHDPGRNLALSDGVFAIAMTLLAFQIQPPNLKGAAVHRLGSALSSMSDRYLVYVLSFAVVALFWLAHHRFFRWVERVDEPLLVLNLAFLLVVAAMPFPSAVLGEYGSEPVAAVIYASAMAIAAALLTVMWVVAFRHRLLLSAVPRSIVRENLWRTATTAGVFAVSIPLALATPLAAQLVWLAVFPVRFAPLARRRRSHRRAGRSAGRVGEEK